MKLSIIIPTYNRKDRLRRCLDLIFAQQAAHPHSVEVIIVDDGSTDKTEEIKREFPSIVYIKQKHKGRSAARNLAIGQARGGILAFIDDDCMIMPDWIESVIRCHDEHQDAFVIQGAVLPQDNKNLFSLNEQYTVLNTDTNDATGKPDYLSLCPVEHIRSNNLSVKKSLFNKKIRFDENIIWWQDRELGYQIQKAQIPIFYSPWIKIIHTHREAICPFVRQHFGRGRGYYTIKRKWGKELDMSKGIDKRLHFLLFVFYDSKKKYGIFKALALLSITFIRRTSFFLGSKYEMFLGLVKINE